MRTTFLSALLIAGMATNASAQNTPAKKIVRSDKHRIHQGVKKGELTKAEAKNLREDKKELKEDTKLAKADGRISKPEKKVLVKEHTKLSRQIYIKKHNNRAKH